MTEIKSPEYDQLNNLIVLFRQVDKMSYTISIMNQCFAILQNTDLVKKRVNSEPKIDTPPLVWN